MKTPLREQLAKAEAEVKKLRHWEARAGRLRREIREHDLAERQVKELTEIESTKALLSNEHGIPRDAAFEACWDLAWEHRYSSGLDEVKYYFNEFIKLVKLARAI